METVKYLRKANSALNSKSPLFLIGHSNGGGMASKIAFIHYKEVKGVLLSSAAGIMRFYQELEYATNMPPHLSTNDL